MTGLGDKWDDAFDWAALFFMRLTMCAGVALGSYVAGYAIYLRDLAGFGLGCAVIVLGVLKGVYGMWLIRRFRRRFQKLKRGERPEWWE